MPHTLLASVIIDNYNYDKYLRQAIDSALSQTYSNVEIIVVDDGSTDNSRDIIKSYGEKIISVFKNNGGQASAFNSGFNKSTGDVIFFLDSDDILFPEAVFNVVHLFLSDVQITKVQWPLWIVDENNNRTGEMRPSQAPPQGNYRDVVLAGGPTSCISSPTSGNAWARHFLEKVFPIPEDVAYYKTCADEYLYTLAPVFGEIKTISQPQGFYRIHGKNIYSALSFDEKLKLELHGHDEQTSVLSSVLRKHGFSVDEKKWKRNSWFHLLVQAREDISRCIPQQDAFILVDDGTWNSQDTFPGHKVLFFKEYDGEYGGAPEDDDVAIKLLLGQIKNGAKYIVFARQSFWWFVHYPFLLEYLRSHFSCIMENERLVVYILKETIIRRNPLVSIIINNYNYAHFLKASIESALDQSYKKIEIIVVDDGSDDGSREVILSYGDQIIPVFKDNSGQGSAYNAGFHKSKGEFVCNLDADDTLFPEAVQKALLLFRDLQVIKVQWPLLITDKYGNSSGEMTTKWSPPDGDLKERILSEGPFYDFNLHTGCMVRRRLLEHILPMPESWYKNGGDVYITTLAPLFGHLRNAGKPLGTYRIHGNNHYAGRILDEERIKNYITRFEMNCVVLDLFSSKLGLKHDRNLWEKRNFNYLWPNRLLKAREDIENLVPAGESYVLVNGDEWGNGEPVGLRKAIPFPEQDGIYSGLPVDDESAIVELEKLRKKGASFLIFWWTSYWWFDHYKKFINYVENNYAHLSKTDSLISYDLRYSF